jgi:glutaredoxin
LFYNSNFYDIIILGGYRMKKLKYFVILLLAILVIPFGVFAEDSEDESTDTSSEESKEVIVYFFRGEGCSHCAEAEEWFESIEEEYGSYFEIKDYETWYDEDNATLMQKVASARGETADGVPYIIIGDKSWNGFTDDYKDEMIEQIKTVFEQDVADRYDIMTYLDAMGDDEESSSSSSDVVALFLIIIVAGGIGYGVYRARKSTN